MTVLEIAKILNGTVDGNTDCEIRSLSKIEEAGQGDITFIANLKYKKYLKTTQASAILIARDATFDELKIRSVPITVIKVDDPYRAFTHLVDLFYPEPQLPAKGIHPTAIIATTALIGTDCSIGPYVVIGERCTIGNATILFPGCVLCDDVKVGTQTVMYPNVTIREQCVIGNHVIIHPGTVIGNDGFGFAPREDGSYEKIPQRGIVVIEDEVEIGANCTIDRATIGQTCINRGTKLDNLIHIAHNVVVGEHTVMAAQTGISGSTKVGRYCAFGGQVGLTGHITIADKTSIGAQSGVPKSITEPGKTYFGYPAKELHETLKIQAATGQLPSLLLEVRALQKRIEELELKLSILSSNHSQG
jgi:UDP-3-O-[3-hydroxymyristoyl] glucosamine N-acyltransferase